MRIKHGTLCLITLFICFACQQKKQEIIVEQAASKFSEYFYNLNYPAAEALATPSSANLLKFLASNVRQQDLDLLHAQTPATVSILESSIDSNGEEAQVICQISNALVIDIIKSKAEITESLVDTLQLTKVGSKWLIKKDIQQQNGTQSHD